jgi:hypothetical protein
MFAVAKENKEPSSSQFPDMQVSLMSQTGQSNTPVISGTFATWPRRTEYCGGSVRKTPSTRGNHASASPCRAIKHPITQRQKAESPHLIREEVRRFVHRLLERVIWYLAKTVERVRRFATAGLFDHEVVVPLPVLDFPDGDGSTGLHDCATEQPVLIPIVRQHVKSHRDGASTFSPAVARVSSRWNQ